MDAAKIAAELTISRVRGIDDLEMATHNQHRVETPYLDRLARIYCVAINCGFYGRVDQMRRLLKDGLVAYAKHGSTDDADLIRELFFDPEDAPRRQSAGERLDAALTKRRFFLPNHLEEKARKRRRPKLDKRKFEPIRRRVLMQFSEFLINFAQEAQ